MDEPWIGNMGMVSGILGAAGGILGGVVGTLAGFFIPKGKAKKLVLGVDIFGFALSCLLLVVGIIAYLSGQPYGIWYGFGLCGLIGTPLYGMLFFVFRSEYRKVELRKSMSEDLTLGGNSGDRDEN
ncbi:MAG: hypothetical protein OXG97_14330 [Candidatus Poribacteria bacterium]|nr:hypothetical protein [Candidatus Poribacteria bacterium]